jgi:peptidoglycan/LPS O-acetylase OafA/YrhL
MALGVLVVTAVGAMISSASGEAYLRGATGRFLVGNLTFLKAHYELTGVFCGQDLCNVNGSLWTLPWEVRCYATLALLALLGASGPRFMAAVILPVTVLGAILWDLDAVRSLAAHRLGDGTVYLITQWDRLWPLFAAGAAAYIFRERLRLSWGGLGLLFILNLVAQHFGFGLHVRGLFVGYAVLCMGLLTVNLVPVRAWPDWSYGMYLFAFPVMMAIHALWPQLPRVGLTLANVVLTLPLAALSWRFVEQPALQLARRALSAGSGEAGFATPLKAP